MAIEMWQCPPEKQAELIEAARLQLMALRGAGYRPMEAGTILAFALASLYGMTEAKVSRKDYAEGVGKVVADLIMQMGGN